MYNKIKILCKEKGTSVHAMEKELGFGGGTISRWKNSNPGLEKILKIANYLDVSVEFLTDFKAQGQKEFIKKFLCLVQRSWNSLKPILIF